MKITIFLTYFLFVGVGVWAAHVPIEEFDNSTIHDEEILSRQERGDRNEAIYRWGMLGAACRIADFVGKLLQKFLLYLTFASMCFVFELNFSEFKKSQ